MSKTLLRSLVPVALLLLPAGATAQVRTEYRAFWVDTFNTALNTHDDVVAVVSAAKAAKANAILAQVRRRGDAWYINSLEPPPDFVPIAPGFDPLLDLINEAHANGIEMHAYVIAAAVWNKNPNFAPTATLGPPTSPNHVFNLHGGYDPLTKQVIPAPDNWLTRTLLPDGAGISFQGHRFGSDFWLDFGHPDAAAYTVDVLTHLVRNYAVDGLHLDRIRYPDFSAAEQTPANGTSIGYNTTSVARFQSHYGIPAGSPPPAQNDPLWNQWRRDQVANVVRRIYLNAVAIRPQIRISASLIAYGYGPTTEAAWGSAEAYWRVYQDWRAWTEEGILDIAIPMNYKREHISSQVTMYGQWNEWTKNHQYGRAGMIGLGVYLNAIEGSLRQTRRALAPSAAGAAGLGVTFFSMANTNAAVSANPFSIPAGLNTPVRPFAEFASALTTGKSADGAVPYEDPVANPVAIFADLASVPELPWKTAPAAGHLMGVARRPNGTPLDTAAVTIEHLDSHAVRSTATDGGGFYGGVDLAPGSYFVKAQLGGDSLYSCSAVVSPGVVTTADLRADIDPPATTATLNPVAPDGTNGWYRQNVTVTLGVTDNCTGTASTETSTDGGATWLPYTGPSVIANEGTTSIQFRSTDRAGNVETAQSLLLKIDKTAPRLSLAADPAEIWPPNGKQVAVTLTGSGADAVSGLAQVSYVVVDEYGTPLAIAPRILTGSSADWTEVLGVEAMRYGADLDGRVYRVTATAADLAGNTSSVEIRITVPHDQRTVSQRFYNQ